MQQLWQHESQQLSQQLLQVLQHETGAQQVCSQHGLAQQVCSQQVGAQHDEAQQRPNRPALASWAAKNDNAATANKAMTRDFMGISPNLGEPNGYEIYESSAAANGFIGDSVVDP
ncbi:MAG: hypothetical protein JNM18_20670 [Planctomycetaceae bacterium]|nr:hypothetical protein [Planctomycetaceae bacterium]